MSITLDQANLDRFTGSEHWYRHWTGAMVYTDGIHYLCENGAAWLIDIVASYQNQAQLRKGDLADFQLWELKVSDRTGIVTCRADSDKKPVITQEIEYTDFSLPDCMSSWEAWTVRHPARCACCLASDNPNTLRPRVHSK